MQVGKFTLEDIQLMNLFEKEFRTKVVDYINDETGMAFVVETNNFGALLGRGGANVKAFQQKLGKMFKVFQYSEDLQQFAKNLAIVPVQSIDIQEKNGKKMVKYKVEQGNKAMLIGREGKNISMIKTLLKRQFDVENVVVD